ncbi:MAG: type II toxin-antitoxin system RelE family toxin [Planctomycetota bacterium]|jgi:mRNA interferase RelE/StbE
MLAQRPQSLFVSKINRLNNKSSKKLRELEADPRPHGYKQLKGKQELYRVRTGDYRIIYTLNDNQLLVLVVKIGNRRDVYQK